MLLTWSVDDTETTSLMTTSFAARHRSWHDTAPHHSRYPIFAPSTVHNRQETQAHEAGSGVDGVAQGVEYRGAHLNSTETDCNGKQLS